MKSRLHLQVTATDKTRSLIERAEAGIYSESSVRDLPREFLQSAFLKNDGGYKIKSCFKIDIEFVEQDIRFQHPGGRFDLILCRNLVFTYFEENLQRVVIREVVEKLESGGFFLVGSHESIPENIRRLSSYSKKSIFRKTE